VGQDITVDGMAKIGDKIGIGLGTIAIDPSFVLDISGHVYSNGNILSRGKIGIGDRGTENNSGVQLGKNEPEFTLDVGGTMRVSDTVTFLGPVFGPAPSLPITDPSGGLQLVTMKWVTDAIGTNGGWVTADNNQSIYNGNIDKVEGYVGIGTTTPSATLDVSGNMLLRGTSTFTGTITAPNANTFGRAKIGTNEANTQNILGNLIVGGDFTVNGNTTTISTTNLDVSTNLISLNNGLIGTSVNDSGILIYRGDASNVFMGWGETSNRFLFGTTAAVSTDIGNLSITPVDIEVHDLTANGNLTLSGSLTAGTTEITSSQLGYLSGVTSNIQTQIGTAMTSSQWTTETRTVTTQSGINHTYAFILDTSSALQNTQDYYITPTANYSINAYTSGSTDTYIRIYQLSSQLQSPITNPVTRTFSNESYTQIDFNDDSTDTNADITFQVFANITYVIAFGCYKAVTGTTTLHIDPTVTTVTTYYEEYLSYNGSVDINGSNGAGSGTVTSGTFNATSDMRLKENIHDLTNSLEKICAIRGVEYNWKADETKKLHSGVIAQEVQECIPEAVNSENKDKYTVDYNAIIGHLIEAVKTLKQEVDDLKGQLKK